MIRSSSLTSNSHAAHSSAPTDGPVLNARAKQHALTNPLMHSVSDLMAKTPIEHVMLFQSAREGTFCSTTVVPYSTRVLHIVQRLHNVTDETLTVVCSSAKERGQTSRSRVTESAHTKLSTTVCSEGNQEFTESCTMPVYVPPVDTLPQARARQL